MGDPLIAPHLVHGNVEMDERQFAKIKVREECISH